MSHQHDHDHDCARDHDHDGDLEEATVEEMVAHLVLSFCQLAFIQADFEQIDNDELLQKKLFLFVFGLVHAFTTQENLEPDQLEAINVQVLEQLFPWEEGMAEACTQDLIDSLDDPAAMAILSEGKAAMTAALTAASTLGDVLSR
jgi:hypothetical protein